MQHSKPLVSVVIPTFNRPQFLPRAVRSALAGMDAKDIEVIVVPNGPDQSWRESLAEFKNNPSVRVIPIPEANANIARNTGMANARGEFIRFLDDDDIIYSDSAVKQYDCLLNDKADIYSGAIELLDKYGKVFGIMEQPQTNDIVSGMLCAKRMPQLTGHIFNRNKIINHHWNPMLKFGQDIEWFLRLCGTTEIIWIKYDLIFGGWTRHTNNRITITSSNNQVRKLVANEIISLAKKLELDSRLTQSRKEACASGIWSCIHSAYCFDPIYWAKWSNIAKEYHKKSKPDIPFYTYNLVKYIDMNPLFWETLFLPKRLFDFYLKRAKLKYGFLSKW